MNCQFYSMEIHFFQIKILWKINEKLTSKYCILVKFYQKESHRTFLKSICTYLQGDTEKFQAKNETKSKFSIFVNIFGQKSMFST